MNKNKEIEEVKDFINKNSINENSTLKKAFLVRVSNIYSLISDVFGKSFGEKYNLEYDEFKWKNAVLKRQNNLMRDLKIKTGLTSSQINEYNNTLADEKYAIIKTKNGEDIRFSKGAVLDLYQVMKNEALANAIKRDYNIDSVNDALKKLDSFDEQYSDIINSHLQNYDELNSINIKLFRLPLQKVNGYYHPYTAEEVIQNESVEYKDGFVYGRTTAGSIHERHGGRYKPTNIINVFTKSINELEYMKNMAEDYKNVFRIVNNRDVRNTIKNKMGQDINSLLTEKLKKNTLSKRMEIQDGVSNLINKFINNWGLAKTSSVPVLIKQATGFLNYSEFVPAHKFYPNFIKALSNPAKTVAYMKSKSDMAEFRLQSGFNQILASALKDKSVSKPMGILQNIFSTPGKYGDAFSNIFGGYAFIQSQISQGISEEEAIKKYEFETIRHQQSSLESSKSSMEESRGIYSRLTNMFLSQSFAIGRKIYDSNIQYQNGEITLQQHIKTVALFTLQNGFVMAMVQQLISAIMPDDDKKKKKKEEDWKQKIILDTFNNSVGNLIGFLPIFSDLTEYSLNELEAGIFEDHNSYRWQRKTPLVDDVIKSINGLVGNKKERHLYPLVNLLFEVGLDIPLDNILKLGSYGTQENLVEDVKKLTDIKKDKRKKY
jgi:hypothetical protein